jgi:hypothetical protein
MLILMLPISTTADGLLVAASNGCPGVSCKVLRSLKLADRWPPVPPTAENQTTKQRLLR